MIKFPMWSTFAKVSDLNYRTSQTAVRALHRYSAVIGWITLTLGAITVAGWLSGSAALAGLFIGLPPMHGFTGLGFSLLGTCLLVIRYQRRWGEQLSLVAAVILLGFALSSLAIHAGWLDSRITSWTLSTPHGLMTAPMPMTSCVVFILFSLRVLSFHRLRSVRVVDAISLMLLAASMIALATLGVSIARNDALSSIPATPMGAALMFANALAWIAVRPSTPLAWIVVARGSGGTVARYLLLPALMLPLIYAWLIQWARNALAMDDTLLISLTAFITGGTASFLVWHVAVFSERNEQKRQELGRLTRAASTDGLTGLANRRSFDETLLHLLKHHADQGRAFSLLLLDLDHFKSYNDSFGHPAGDEVLRRVGTLLPESLRGGDMAARYGGEEFAVLLSDCTAPSALRTAERIRLGFTLDPWPHRPVTVSIGVTQSRAGDTAERLIERADQALYAAKQQGRNRVASA
ncbi:MAG TPA: GGDEF domain-containing protein [Chiayiivirga sp.]|nr:GGDEF domain-containing protein [Chiayiivirga sp.]